VRQYQPYINASICAQYLAINASKYKFNRIITTLLKTIPFVNLNTVISLSGSQAIIQDSAVYDSMSSIVGVKVQLSGLLSTSPNYARKTVYTASAGTLSKNLSITLPNSLSVSAHTVVDYANSTTKSRVGAFTVKV
jgi:hypothetical protein